MKEKNTAFPVQENASSSQNANIEAEKIALRLIARAEQNSRGLLNKLLLRGVEISIGKEVIDSLLDRNLLNDERYAELWIKSRLAGRKAASPRQLMNTLRNKGIDKYSLKEAMEKSFDSDSEFILLCNFLDKNPENKELDENYLIPLLKYEGFSADSINRYFEGNE